MGILTDIPRFVRSRCIAVPLKRSHTYCLFEALATSPKEIASIHAALFAI
ncbi:MAG: hypothetical protein KME31_22155 [Tolypothrix carrinoi HA7290-LM1]|nr:hypothetical protein [Tolypothrix carrinoi HA7290-LM1]